MMQRTKFISRTKRLKQVHSLPTIHQYLIKGNYDNKSINASSTTNESIIKNNNNNSTLMSNKNIILLKKIKLNDKIRSQRLRFNNSVIINPTNTHKKTIQILENADQIMKERLKFNGVRIGGSRNILKSVALKLSREVCLKNYTINLLKQKRIEINEKEFIRNNALNEFSDQYEKDRRIFANFVEELKTRHRKEEEAYFDIKQMREQKENLCENEKLSNKKLTENLERKIKELYIIKKYGSFFHKILEKKFIYDGTPEIKNRERNYELIADLIINIYESKDKLMELPKELDNIDLFMKKYMLLEDKILSNISDKEIIDKEITKYKKNYESELEQLKISKTAYESDLNYLKNEIKNVKIEMKNYKIHKDENFEKYLHYIIELGKEIGTNVEMPKTLDKRYLTYLVLFSKKTLEILRNIESNINTNILEIENILNYGDKEDVKIMEKAILTQKNINKREKQLEIKRIHEEMKILKNLKIIERANKPIVKGRKIIFDYPICKNKNKSQQIIKEEDDDNHYEYEYSNSDDNN